MISRFDCSLFTVFTVFFLVAAKIFYCPQAKAKSKNGPKLSCLVNIFLKPKKDKEHSEHREHPEPVSVFGLG